MTHKALSRNQIAWRAAQDLEDGMLVNLGLGMPVLCANYRPEGREVLLQSENGIVGVGPVATPEEADRDLTDAGSQLITLIPGASVFSSSDSFAMIRGGHIDVTLLGGFEVSETGDLANWDAEMPGKGPLIGGAMDLAVGAKEVRIMMQHTTRNGEPRLLETCRYKLTAPNCVKRVYTDLAVVDVTPEGFLVREIVDGLAREELQAKSGATLRFADDCKVLSTPEV
ncbi:MAG: 3-oxoacid CoA-transferase subunit B [Alphaproteobacteria bacterium]|nr:3-oxoacid CoA-transferase subunit B [Alphaproteobacteria bacterium]